MRNLFIPLLIAIMCLSMCACGASEVERALVECNWINVNNGDVYTFIENGSGSHDSISITYKVDGTTINIIEGASNVHPTPFTLDLESTLPKLIPLEDNSFYVRDIDYDTVSEQIKQENMTILTSSEFWTTIIDGAVNYISFKESGSGWFMVSDLTLVHQWEFVDNNTIKITVNENGGYSITLDVINNNGNPQLVNAKTGIVTYVPKH